MAKTVVKKLKLQIEGGKANPTPPVGPALGQAGINIGEFITKFNDATRDRMGNVVPVEILVYEDRSYDFILKTAPASRLLIKAAGVKKGSGKNKVSQAGSVTKMQLREMAEEKIVDLNTKDVEVAMRIIEGTARSMGIKIK